MRYSYYPGCSLHSAHKGYDISCRAVFEKLGCELTEIDDWNCCGATIYMSIKRVTSLAISTRNLAIAEQKGLDVIAPCSSCFTVLDKANKTLKNSPELHDKVNDCLAESGLKYNGTVRIRHPLDVLVNDIGNSIIELYLKHPLHGLKIANYYGCQIVRPDKGFDDREDPTSMESIFETIGAENVYYPCKLRCCGGMLMTTLTEASLQLSKDLLERAIENKADCIVTTCPLCQMNLEAYQNKINKFYHTDYHVPIFFFTQLLGVALGIPKEKLGLESNFYSCEKLEDLISNASTMVV